MTKRKPTRAEHKAAVSADLEAAQRARKKGHWREAIKHYEDLLEREPGRADLRVRIAELYAQHGAVEAARASYQTAAEAYLHFGERDKALSVFIGAARMVRCDPQLWSKAADLELEKHHRGNAMRHLLDGGKALIHANMHQHAVRLLRRAFSLEPFHPDVGLALGHALLATGRKAEARSLWLRIGLAARRRDIVRRARWALARHFPTPINLWRVLVP